MPFTETGIPGLLVFEPNIIRDARGYFFESFNSKIWKEKGITSEFVQDNQAYSTRGILRGLHYQLNPNAQAKLVRVIEGEVLDVVVDLRKGSPSFGKTFSIILSAENHKQMYVPRGFAHGYCVLSSTALFFYKCDNFYSKESERGIAFNDSALNIDWKIPAGEMLLSDKDKLNKPFSEAEMNFVFDEKNIFS
ncbi:MAG TPA: dTDP-4-dehydrorhamnose 3,5-epimerase [Bacteroidetes bacterium]|nr:dTDP-4-dehydrorhamnose 3,5-epimerase [Bacteroidota bacterium]